MFLCDLCPGRSFKDENSINMHKRSGKHAWYSCGKCNRGFQTQPGLEQHINVMHPAFECQYCDKEFATDNGRLSHQAAKHSSMFECEYCDKEFTTDEGRLAHEKAKHSVFECEYCDEEFKSEDACQQHEKDKHSMFECEYCDEEFKSEDACQQHEKDKHSMFECEYCDKEFKSEDACQQHEKDKHSMFECEYCDKEFKSEDACQQHEDAKHTTFKCTLCYQSFVGAEALRLHEKTPHFNPLWSGSQSSSDAGSTDIAEEERSTSASTEHTDEDSVSPASPSHSSNSSLGEGEMFHSTSGAAPTDAASDEPPRRCERGTCSISPQLPSTDKSTQDDLGSVVFSDSHQDSSTECMLCMDIFNSEEALRGHICATRTSMLRPHCPVCYSQFDNASLLQQHLEGPQSMFCQLCLTRCCSDEMMQDHLLSHPTCSKCGISFADDLALCAHVESDHPAVVCWDCDGIVVEHSTLELHYADSPAHPSCVFCSLGKRNSTEMDEHIKHAHPGAEIEHPERNNASLDAVTPNEETPGTNRGDTVPYEGLDCTPAVAVIGGDEIHNSLLRSESSLSSSPQRSMVPVESVNKVVTNALSANGEEPPDVGIHLVVSPSPAPSEHGSSVSQVRLHVSGITHAAINNDTRPPSPVSTVSAEAFSDLSNSTQTSSTTSSHSVVFVSADEIPDYIRENRARLVATSASSPSSGGTPLRLPSWSSLESLDVSGGAANEGSASTLDATVPPQPHASNPRHRLHCRICMQDPCKDMTATICGHLFCKRCITRAVVAKSECPVCKSATLLYCLFKLDLSV